MEHRSVEPFIVEPLGDLDASNAAREIYDPILAALQKGHRNLVLDFSRVRFVDSTTMSFLLKGRGLVVTSGGRLLLANVQPPIQRFFQVAGTADLFEGVEEG